MKTGIVVAVAVVALLALLLWPAGREISNEEMYGPAIEGGQYAAQIGKPCEFSVDGVIGDPPHVISGILLQEYADVLVVDKNGQQFLISKGLISR